MIFLFALMLAAEPAAAMSAEPLIADCEAHRFETIVRGTVGGKPRSSKVKLCGKTGQTDADWLNTLKDAIDKVKANDGMSATAKEQVIAALNVEIARLTPAVETSPAPPAEISPPPASIVALPTEISPPPATIVALPPARAASPSAGVPVEYSALPPLPAPKPAASIGVAAAAEPPPLPAPRMTFRCIATDRLGAEGECDLLERNTLLTVRADEDLPGGTSLRFMRRGDDRGEIDLPALRTGQSRRFSLPPKLCAGVSGSRVQIEVVRANGKSSQVVDTHGPYELRC
jgi:hypothetical protein